MIRKVIEKTPNDPFARYGLAMELRSLGRHDEALAAFTDLATRLPDYVPQYLMHAQLLVQLGKKDEARAVAEAGVTIAKKRGDAHAAGELGALLDDLAD